jgi:hypothetical protein
MGLPPFLGIAPTLLPGGKLGSGKAFGGIVIAASARESLSWLVSVINLHKSHTV